MKKILNYTVMIIAGTFLLASCAGVKKEAPAPGPANDLAPQAAPAVNSSMKLLDRIQYGKTYVGEAGDVPQEDILKLAERVVQSTPEARAEANKKAVEELVKPRMQEAEVIFSKEGELVSSLAARDKEKKSHVVCAAVKIKATESDEAAITKQAEDRESAEEAKAKLVTDRAEKEAQLQGIVSKKDEERTDEDKTNLETIPRQIEQTDATLSGIEGTLAEINKRETTKTTLDAETLCYTFKKEELEKKVESETRFTQAGVTETRYNEDGSSKSEGIVSLQFDISKDGSSISNGSVTRDGKDATTALFSLNLKADQGKKEDNKGKTKDDII